MIDKANSRLRELIGAFLCSATDVSYADGRKHELKPSFSTCRKFL